MARPTIAKCLRRIPSLLCCEGCAKPFTGHAGQTGGAGGASGARMTNLRSGVTHAADVRSGGLLATKLVPPLPRWRPVRRPRLLSLLEAGTCGPLTVLAAPAGAGKTMLLVSWVADGQPPGPVAWVTVDRGDEDPARFWAHVLAALREGGALPPEGLLAGLATPHRNVDQEFLAVLVNGLAELPGP